MKKMKQKLPTRNVLVSLALTAGIAAPIAAVRGGFARAP